jgi:pimeloyl-ACP methyl ester carboxylesterase
MASHVIVPIMAWILCLFLSPFCLLGYELFPAVQQCSVETGGGVCPVQNTCCRLTTNDGNATTIGSSCIPSDLGAFVATCCSDGLTGCGVGYECDASNNFLNNSQYCVATSAISDPLVQVLPRYHLCRAGNHSNFQQIYYWDVFSNATNSQLLYYSSHGAIEEIGDVDRLKMKNVLIVVHGANRNADDYFCAATSAVGLQSKWPIEQVLVLAPRFVVPNDLPTRLHDKTLMWEDIPDGPWRYGAHAMFTNVTSFDGMDSLVEQLVTVQFPNAITTIVGHSSGGQFVQRWSLLSPWAGRIHAVVANPSCYAYLTPERYDPAEQKWHEPNRTLCSRYNQWEWGLETAKDTPGYIKKVLKAFYNSSNEQQPFHRLVDRFANQSVVYLAGSLDRCNVSSTSGGWCNSHGLEATCGDELQGTNRWGRIERYMAMLKGVGVQKHRKVVVHGVGHDHSLMFSSPEGLDVLFPVKRTIELASRLADQ